MRFLTRAKLFFMRKWRGYRHEQQVKTPGRPVRVAPTVQPAAPAAQATGAPLFAHTLQRRGLVELAEDICNSWQDGYIGQDADGWAILYNGPIGVHSEGWRNLRQKPGISHFLLAQLEKDPDWYECVLPVRALWQPVPDLSHVQRSFLIALIQAGSDRKAKAFIEKWTPDSWIAMDKDGTTYVYNTEPRLRHEAWSIGCHQNGDWIFLANLREPGLNWEQCLVRLNRLRLSSQPVVIEPVRADDSPDCWL